MKRKKLEANHWILLVAVVVGGIVLADYGLKKASEPPLIPKREKDPYEPKYPEGSRVRDFSLPDRQGRSRNFYEFVSQETFVFFVQDDDRSRALVRYAAKLFERRRKAKVRVPRVLTIAGFDPAREAAWLRDTGLEQTVLYEKEGGKVSDDYRADPRPRAYQFLEGANLVTYGPTTAQAAMYDVALAVREMLRLRSPFKGPVDTGAPFPEECRRFGPGPAITPAASPSSAAGAASPTS